MSGHQQGLSAEEREAMEVALDGGRVYDDVPAVVAGFIADREARLAQASAENERLARQVAAVEALVQRADNPWARSPGERDGYVRARDLRAALDAPGDALVRRDACPADHGASCCGAPEACRAAMDRAERVERGADQ